MRVLRTGRISLCLNLRLFSLLSSKSDADLIHTEENELKIVSGSMTIRRMDPWRRQLMEIKLIHSARSLTTSVIGEAKKSKHATAYQGQAPSSLHMDRALSSLSLDFKEYNSM